MKALMLAPMLLALAACAAPQQTPVREAAATSVPVVGGDRDAHGCIGSAGYQWCERSQRCERPWELAQAQGLANTVEAIDAYCAMPAQPARR